MPADRDTIIFANDKAGNIILAALLRGEQKSIKLDAHSTAAALCSFMSGPHPKESSSAKLDATIEAVPGFAKLTTLITSALAAGKPPMDYPGVADQIDVVLAEASQQLSHATK